MKKYKKILTIVGVILLIVVVIIVQQPKKSSPIIQTEPIIPSNNVSFTASDSAEQINNDLKFGRAIQALVDEYPWYTQIPVETEDYRIIFDFDKKQFRIRLLNQSTDPIKQAAIKNLTKIGVDLKKFSYYFIEP